MPELGVRYSGWNPKMLNLLGLVCEDKGLSKELQNDPDEFHRVENVLPLFPHCERGEKCHFGLR